MLIIHHNIHILFNFFLFEIPNQLLFQLSNQPSLGAVVVGGVLGRPAVWFLPHPGGCDTLCGRPPSPAVYQRPGGADVLPIRVGVTLHLLCARRRSDAIAHGLCLPYSWAMGGLAAYRWPETANRCLARLPPPHGVTLVDITAAGYLGALLGWS